MLDSAMYGALPFESRPGPSASLESLLLLLVLPPIEKRTALLSAQLVKRRATQSSEYQAYNETVHSTGHSF